MCHIKGKVGEKHICLDFLFPHPLNAEAPNVLGDGGATR